MDEIEIEIQGAPSQMTGKRLPNARFVPRLGMASFVALPTGVDGVRLDGDGLPVALSLRRRAQRDDVHFKGRGGRSLS